MPTYLRKPGSDVWHWCRNCPRLPRGVAYDVLYSRPATGRLCSHCQTLSREGACVTCLVPDSPDIEGKFEEGAASSPVA